MTEVLWVKFFYKKKKFFLDKQTKPNFRNKKIIRLIVFFVVKSTRWDEEDENVNGFPIKNVLYNMARKLFLNDNLLYSKYQYIDSPINSMSYWFKKRRFTHK